MLGRLTNVAAIGLQSTFLSVKNEVRKPISRRITILFLCETEISTKISREQETRFPLSERCSASRNEKWTCTCDVEQLVVISLEMWRVTAWNEFTVELRDKFPYQGKSVDEVKILMSSDLHTTKNSDWPLQSRGNLASGTGTHHLVSLSRGGAHRQIWIHYFH